MNKRFLLLGLVLFFASTMNVFAKDNCANNDLGNIVCAPAGGSIMTNKDGMVVCGLGQCVVNKSGMFLCSAQPGGTASVNNQGVAVCSGMCVTPSKNNCKGAR